MISQARNKVIHPADASNKSTVSVDLIEDIIDFEVDAYGEKRGAGEVPSEEFANGFVAGLETAKNKLITAFQHSND